MRCGIGLTTAAHIALAALAGCDRGAPTAPANAEHADGTPAAATNRVAIPDTVRRNLGIRFARVESRPVAQTIRVPGRFELLPDARREYRTMLAGRIELQVKQFDRVATGAVLYRLASPEWRELQQRLSEAESAIRQAEARVASIPSLLAAHRNHEEILREGVALWQQRAAELEQTRGTGAVTVDELTAARTTLAMKRAELAEVLEREAELEAQSAEAIAQHDTAHSRFRLLLATASTLLGVPERELSAPYDIDEHLHTGIHDHTQPTSRPIPAWRRIDEVEVRAAVPGIVQSLDLTNGAWASAGSLVLATIEPDRLRFRALGMQSDLGRLRDGLPARIVPPTGGAIDMQDSMDAAFNIGLSADPLERTIELIAAPTKLSAWARPGFAAHLEITVAGGTNELAIPLSSVIQDGLAKLIFRRDPKNPDEVIRMEADLGVSDGRWIAIHSGVREGDEVVLDGVYQLMIATSGSVTKGGHFHADGTFHAGEDH